MKLKEIVKALGLEMKNKASLEKEANGCYVSDMLSDVLANGKEGNVWITRQTHPNVVAVAAIKGLCAIIIAGDKPIEDNTIQKANSEDIPILSTGLQTFEAAGALYLLLKPEEAR